MDEADDAVAAALRVATMAGIAQRLKLEGTNDLEAVWHGGAEALLALARIVERVIDCRVAETERKAEALERRLFAFEKRHFEAAVHKTLLALRLR